MTNLQTSVLTLFLILFAGNCIAQKNHNPKDPPTEIRIIDADTQLPLDSVRAVVASYSRKGKITSTSRVLFNKVWIVKGNEIFPEFFEKDGYTAGNIPAEEWNPDLIFYSVDKTKLTVKLKRKK
jgi:hypothetical protein